MERKLGASYEPSATATRTLGSSLLVGPSMLRIPCVNLPLDSLPSNAYSVTNHRYSPGLESCQKYPVDYWFRQNERVWDDAHHQLQCAVRRHKMTADLRRSEAPQYQPGQKVWLSMRNIRMRLPCKKLTPRYVGPFTILRQINPVTFQLQLPP